MTVGRSGKFRESRRSGVTPGSFFAALRRFGCQKFTIMLVPHSEKRTIHFQLSLFAMALLITVFFALFAGFFWFSLDFSGKEALLAARSRDLAETEASLDVIRDEVGTLVSSATNFRNSLEETVDILGIREAAADPATSGGGDLSSLFTFEQSPGDAMAEVSDLKALRISLDDSVVRLEDIGLVLSSQKNLLSDIPTVWPLKGARGVVTQVFGPSIHPIYSVWYLHRGLDLGYFLGTPIVATADGTVVRKGNEPSGFGLYIDLQHKYGFKTRYAHMQRQLVDVGQKVSQGEVIGTMGSTGQSTGSHLHYEVMIGTQLVDPIKFLNMTHPSESFKNVAPSLLRYR